MIKYNADVSHLYSNLPQFYSDWCKGSPTHANNFHIQCKCYTLIYFTQKVPHLQIIP